MKCNLFRKDRVTCLLGAGTTIPVGGPTTSAITTAARQRQQHVIDPTSNSWINVAFIDEIAARLDDYLAPHRCHFEDIFHVLEMLESYGAGWRFGTHEKFKPRPGAFVVPSSERFFNSMWLIAAKRSLIEAIAEQVEASVAHFEPTGRHQWFQKFWLEALDRVRWDIGTLNYDNLLEQLCPDLVDGFGSGSPGRFDPRLLWHSQHSRILHLHGSLFYGYIPPSQEKHFVDHWEDLCKFRSHLDARETWFGRSSATAQSHEESVIGPLITGLRKTDKLTIHPYDEYQAVFRRSIYNSPRLLIAGYSFGDLYLNSILDRMLALHGNRRRIVIITWFPGGKDDWHSDPAVLNRDLGWPGMEMLFSLGAAMNSVHPLGDSLVYHEVLTSPDSCCRIYLGGTQKAFQEHGQEILDFLMS